MNPVALGIPPALDAKQALRLRRFGIATLSYVLATALIGVAWMFGVLPASAVLEAAAAFVAINLCLYAVIRSGFNLQRSALRSVGTPPLCAPAHGLRRQTRGCYR